MIVTRSVQSGGREGIGNGHGGELTPIQRQGCGSGQGSHHDPTNSSGAEDVTQSSGMPIRITEPEMIQTVSGRSGTRSCSFITPSKKGDFLPAVSFGMSGDPRERDPIGDGLTRANRAHGIS